MKEIPPLTRSDKIKDCIFLIFVTQLSFAFYVSRLGFYSDDWAFLSVLASSPDQSLIGLYRALAHETEMQPVREMSMRPIQQTYLSFLYYIFRDNPLGYHLVNGLFIIILPIVSYLCICRLTRSRVIAVSLPLVYIFLPHYSSDRFWIASFQAILSVIFYFLYLYADISYLTAKINYMWLFLLLGAVSLVLSLLAYEVLLPFFLVTPLILLGYTAYRLKANSEEVDPKILKTYRARIIGLLLRNIVLILPIILFKLRYTTRLRMKTGYIDQMVTLLKSAFTINFNRLGYGFNFKRALIVNYVDYILGVPHILFKTFSMYRNPWVITISLAAGLVSCGYIYYLLRSQDIVLPGAGLGRKMTFGGIIVCFAGYAIFLTNTNIHLTLTGMDNRTSIAAALGVTITLVGCVIWLSSLLPTQKLRKISYCFGIAFLVSYGSLIINTVSLFWINAYTQQRDIVAKIREDNPTIDQGSTMLLDGACIFDGPAVIIRTDWDMTGILRILYHSQKLKGDVIRMSMEFDEHGISLSLYGVYQFYQYSDKLLIYNYVMRRTYQITNYQQALDYFELTTDAMNTKCPYEDEGLGVSVF